MSDALLIILVLSVAIGGLIAVAYLLDKRGRKSKNIGPTLPEPGPVTKALLWIARILVLLMVISLVGAIVFGSLPLARFTGILLAIYIFDGVIYRVIRSTGK